MHGQVSGYLGRNLLSGQFPIPQKQCTGSPLNVETCQVDEDHPCWHRPMRSAVLSSSGQILVTPSTLISWGKRATQGKVCVCWGPESWHPYWMTSVASLKVTDSGENHEWPRISLIGIWDYCFAFGKLLQEKVNPRGLEGRDWLNKHICIWCLKTTVKMGWECPHWYRHVGWRLKVNTCLVLGSVLGI